MASEAGVQVSAVAVPPNLSVLLPWPGGRVGDGGMEALRRRARAKLVDLYGGAHVESQTWGDEECRVVALSVLITDEQMQDERATRALGEFLRSLPMGDEHGSVHVLLGRQLFTIASAGRPADQQPPARTEES